MSRSQVLIAGLAAFFLALVAIVYRAGEAGRKEAAADTIGAPAPEFSLPGEDGTTRSLAALRGRAVLVNFWATWCPPCAEETPSLEALHRQLSPEGLVVLGVSVDESWEPVRAFRERFGVTYALALDPRAEVAHRYGTFKYPETYLVDGQGRIARRWIGAVDWTSDAVVGEIRRAIQP